MKSFLGLFGGNDDSNRDAPVAQKEKRRESRLDVGSDSSLRFRMRVPHTGGEMEVVARVVNVSARGLRLAMDGPSRALLQIGQDVSGLLGIDGSEIGLTLRLVRFIGEEEGGFRIRPPFPKALEQLERYLEPRFLGRSLREIDPATLQRQAGDTRSMRWFQGLNETHLFSWTESGEIVHQQLLFLERVVEWSGNGRIQTGRVRGEGPGLAGWVKAELLEFDTRPDAGLLAQARVLLDNAPIEQKVRQTFQVKMTHVD